MCKPGCIWCRSNQDVADAMRRAGKRKITDGERADILQHRLDTMKKSMRKAREQLLDIVGGLTPIARIDAAEIQLNKALRNDAKAARRMK